MYQIKEIYPARVIKKDLELSAQLNSSLKNVKYISPKELENKIPVKNKIVTVEESFKPNIFGRFIEKEKIIISTLKGSVIILSERH